MNVKTEFLSRGYPYCTATLYIYCDECGSFNIKPCISLGKWLLFIAACGIIAIVPLMIFAVGLISSFTSLLIVGLLICVLAYKFLWEDTDYECKKCGNFTSTAHNTLSYPSDMRIVDVPDRLIQKHTLGYWPDLYDMHEMVTSDSCEVWECEECGATVAPAATVCPFCGAQFEN